MNCKNCGSTIEVNSQFCKNCGKNIEKTEEQPKPIIKSDDPIVLKYLENARSKQTTYNKSSENNLPNLSIGVSGQIICTRCQHTDFAFVEEIKRPSLAIKIIDFLCNIGICAFLLLAIFSETVSILFTELKINGPALIAILIISLIAKFIVLIIKAIIGYAGSRTKAICKHCGKKYISN